MAEQGSEPELEESEDDLKQCSLLEKYDGKDGKFVKGKDITDASYKSVEKWAKKKVK